MNHFTLFRKFDNFFEAHLIKSKLEARGIHCLLMDDNTFSAWGGAVGQIQLLIPQEEHLSAAEIIIKDELAAEEERNSEGFDNDDLDQLDPSNRICCFCGSKNTRRKEDEKDAPFLSWLLSKFTHQSLNSDEWHCFHCGKDF